jgi:acetyl esterase/lipase
MNTENAMDQKRKFEKMDDSFFHIPDADVSFVKRKFLDLPYANISNAQKLDIFLPDSGGDPFPVILHIHGGAFAIGDKRDIHLTPYLQGLTRGYAVVSVNYRLSGEAKFPAGLQDIKASVRWLKANSKKYLLDGSRIAACGGSAGGNFSAMLCVTSKIHEFDEPSLGNIDYSSDVQAAVDWFGPIDFLSMDAQLAESHLGPCDHNEAHSPESRYLGAKITDIPEIVKRANPTAYIHSEMPPIFIQHGRQDNLVPVQQSENFVKELEKKIPQDRIEFEILENAGHGDPAFESDRNMEKVFRFLEKFLKKA